jgi:hypothetical protein
MTKSEEKPQLSTETMAHRVSHIGSRTNGTFSTNCSAVKLFSIPESLSQKVALARRSGKAQESSSQKES